MKKFLALVLALVMTMSLVTIAGAKDFTDDASITYEEAVDVMTAAGVVGGYADGSFNPTAGLTRGAAAKIICNMLLGPTTAEALVANDAPFSDVAVDNVFAGYIAYCANEGIISGYADGTFKPAAPLTGYAFMKMLLGALGYDAAIEGYTGSNWSIQVAKRALNIELDKGLVGAFSGAKALTREEACLYAFNAMNTKMVSYDTKSTISVGDLVISQNSDAKVGTELFREVYFKKLDKETGAGDNTDVYGRPAHTWYTSTTKHNADTKIGTYADAADLTYTGAEFDADLVEELEKDYDFSGADYWYNGGVDANVNTNAELNRNGYAIELFIDDDDKVTDVVVIESYVAELTTINTDDDDKVTDVVVTVLEASKGGTGDTITIDVEDDEAAYAMVADYAEEDIFMVTVLPGWDASGVDADDVLLAVDEVETVEGKVTRAELNNYEGWLKVDGVKYEFAWEYSQASVDVDSEGTFYLYNDYVVHFAGTDADDEYALVVRKGTTTDKWENDSYFVEVVYTNGTSAELVIDATSYAALAATGNVVTFEYNEDDEVYNLDVVPGYIGAASIAKGKTLIDGEDNATANGATVFVVVEKDGAAFDKATVYTGYKAVKSIAASAAWVVNGTDGVADYVFAIFSNDTDSSAEDLVYVAGASVSTLVKDTDLGNYYTYNAVVDGKIETIMVKSSVSGAASMDGLYDYAQVNSDGLYTTLTDAADDYAVVSSTNFKKAADDVVTFGNTAFAYTDDVVVFVIDTDGVITAGSINKNYSNVNVLYTANDDGEVTSLYIEKLA